MKKFEVTITETLVKRVKIEAKDYKDAIKQVSDRYYAEEGDIVLSDNDYAGTDFDVLDVSSTLL